MSINSVIKDGTGSGFGARITENGELITRPVAYSRFYQAICDTINVGFNLVEPLQDKQFVVTGFVAYANKDVGVNDATISIYEATASDTTTVDRLIFNQQIPKQENVTFTGMKILTKRGSYINAKTNDNTLYVNLVGYHIDVTSEEAL